MCGIAGIITNQGSVPNQIDLKILSDQLLNRGPDNLGVSTYGQVGFVHTRLSIIDLSVEANQPFEVLHEGLTYVISFNGEIYNYLKIRQELQEKGVQFGTNSDTEVILKAYIHYGSSFVGKLRGMFAFAIYDPQNNEVFLARDHFGKKPLYYSLHNNRFVFSSEIKGIKQVSSGFTLNYEALNYYFTELSMPQTACIWNEVKQLEPGHYLRLNLSQLSIRKENYHSFNEIQKQDISFEEAMNSVETELKKAVNRRKISDVPIGYFLSGGVDSGLIVAMAAENSKISTYSVGYEDSPISELPEARTLAQKCGTDHHEVIIKPDIENDLEEILSHFGEPFADASAIPSFYISKEMKKNVKVAISGDGGDENFGYQSYSFFHQVDQFSEGKTDQALKRKIFLSKLKSRIGSGVNFGQFEETLFRERKGSVYKREMALSFHDLQKIWKSDAGLSQIGFTDDYMDRIWENAKGDLLTDKVITGSFRTRLLNDYLVKVDRMSMANSLEVRSPFLDVDFAEKMLTIPNEYKLQDGVPKFILKKLAEKWVNPDIMNREKKGFGIPVNDWLKSDLKKKADYYLDEVLSKSELFNSSYIQDLKNEFYQADKVVSYKIWTLICLAIWMKNEL
ncbi:MAG: asparagine synthase (glutamine-hydrolyzing) [Crocinitomicaceae bacterium]